MTKITPNNWECEQLAKLNENQAIAYRSDSCIPTISDKLVKELEGIALIYSRRARLWRQMGKEASL